MTFGWQVLAQAATQPGSGQPSPQGGGLDFVRVWLPLILMIAVFYWLLARGQRKERDKHARMLKSLQRNDRVLTIGGVIATVVEVRDNEVVLKVDETNNVKMRFARSAIKEVLAEAEKK